MSKKVKALTIALHKNKWVVGELFSNYVMIDGQLVSDGKYYIRKHTKNNFVDYLVDFNTICEITN